MSRLRRGVGRALVALAAVLTTGDMPRGAGAQALYDVVYRPPEVRYDVLETPHFDLIYQRGLEAEAREAATILERELPAAYALVGSHRRLHMPVVLNGFNDRSNGYVSPLPFRQEIEGVRIKGSRLSPRYTSWLEAVMPHELVHAVQADHGSHLGVGALYRFVGPDLARAMNFAVPAGITEGAAVYHESRIRDGAGRLHHALFKMEFRAAMDRADPWSLAQLTERSAYTRPFDRHYKGGSHFFAYLAARDSAAFFRRAADFHYTIPFLGYGVELWYGAGQRPSRLAEAFRREVREREQAFRAQVEPWSIHRVVATRKGRIHRRPRWLPDGSLLAYASGYALRPGFYRFDPATGARALVSHQRVIEDYQFTHDDGALYFARYVPDPQVPIQALSEAFRLDLATGTATRLTDGGRVVAPVPVGGEVWAVQNDGQFSQLVRLEAGAPPTRLTDWVRTTVLSLAPTPAADAVAVLANLDGEQGIFRLDPGRPDVLQPWVLFPDASVYDLAWSPDGRFLLFSADPGGVVNAFALDREAGEVAQLTSAVYGALEPTLSPDGRTLAFVHYRHERYDLAVQPFAPERAPRVPRARWEPPADRDGAPRRAPPPAARPDPPPTADDYALRSYRPGRYLRPRLLLPFVAREPDLGLQVGATLGGTDPLQRWSYAATGFYQHGRPWGSLRVQTGRWWARPTLSLYDQPAAVSRLVDGTPTRLVREQRGAALTLQAPLIAQANVRTTSAQFFLRTELEQERLATLDDGRTLRPFETRATLLPAAAVGYRLQQNPRDLVPNTGAVLNLAAQVVPWDEAPGPRGRAGYGTLDLYLPWLHRHNVGLRVHGGVFARNAGPSFDYDFFLPRGYQDEAVVLREGVFGRFGAEYTQPIWYIDDGFFLVPIYFKALYAYAFAESLRPISAGEILALEDGVRTRAPHLTTAGGGLVLETRVFYQLELNLRLAGAYRFGVDQGFTEIYR